VKYDRSGLRELRNTTRALLERVEEGEQVVITVDGRAVASLQPVGSRPRWMSRYLDLAELSVIRV